MDAWRLGSERVNLDSTCLGVPNGNPTCLVCKEYESVEGIACDCINVEVKATLFEFSFIEYVLYPNEVRFRTEDYDLCLADLLENHDFTAVSEGYTLHLRAGP